MPDEATPTAAPNAGLEDLERRLASFESATKRLGRTVGSIAEPAGHTSPPRPATRRLSESGAPRGEEISGLRPAVASQGPQTGALTARARARGSSGAPPGFTSAFGKPSIPAPPAVVPTAAPPATPPVAGTARWLWAGGATALISIGALLLWLPRSFPVLSGGSVWASTVQILAPVDGRIEALPVAVGEHVAAGRDVARISRTSVPSPLDGIVTRIVVPIDTRVTKGEAIAELARPESKRIVVPIPAGAEVGIGDRVYIIQQGQQHGLDGNVELILGVGTPDFWSGPGTSPQRAVILPAPSMSELAIGRSVSITIIGSRSGRQFLFALRQLLPW